MVIICRSEVIYTLQSYITPYNHSEESMSQLYKEMKNCFCLGIVDNSIYSHISLLQTNKPKWLNLQTDANTEKGMKVGN